MTTMTKKSEPAVWVLAADEDVVVRFDDWRVVDALYRFVGRLQAAQVGRGDFRVLGASVEVDSTAVRAWSVTVGSLPDDLTLAGIGDGALLGPAAAEFVEERRELRSLVLKIGDDGMLIVEDEDALESTIDLTALVAAGREERVR